MRRGSGGIGRGVAATAHRAVSELKQEDHLKPKAAAERPAARSIVRKAWAADLLTPHPTRPEARAACARGGR